MSLPEDAQPPPPLLSSTAEEGCTVTGFIYLHESDRSHRLALFIGSCGSHPETQPNAVLFEALQRKELEVELS